MELIYSKEFWIQRLSFTHQPSGCGPGIRLPEIPMKAGGKRVVEESRRIADMAYEAKLLLLTSTTAIH
jgi:hypothetical protein